MPSHRDFPNELWLHVFSYVPTDTLPAVSSANYNFCRLTRPILFTHFDFHPYARDRYTPGTLGLPSSKNVERAMERLHFWCSDEIAPYVSSIKISPWMSYSWSMWTWTSSPTGSFYILWDLLFAHLQSFTRLQRLTADCVELTTTAMSSLCRMSALQHLSLNSCEFVAEEGLDLSGLAFSSFTNNVQYAAPARSFNLKPWLPLLSPDHLLELHLTCDIRIWSDNVSAVPDFPHVRRLSISLHPGRVSENNRNFKILFKFRNVEVLNILDRTERGKPGGDFAYRLQDSELPVLPALKQLTGLCNYLPIARRSALTHLDIRYCTSDEFLTQLERLQNPATITSLLLRGKPVLDDTALDRIFTLCFRLVEFKLTFTENTPGKVPRLCKALLRSPSVPLTLKSLCFYGMITHGSNPRGLDQSELQAIRAALVSRCPALTFLWLSGPCFAFVWRKQADKIFEKSVEGLDLAGVMAQSVEDVWDMR